MTLIRAGALSDLARAPPSSTTPARFETRVSGMNRGEVKSSDFTLDLTHGKQVISTQKGQNKSQCEDSTRKEDTQA